MMFSLINPISKIVYVDSKFILDITIKRNTFYVSINDGNGIIKLPYTRLLKNPYRTMFGIPKNCGAIGCDGKRIKCYIF